VNTIKEKRTGVKKIPNDDAKTHSTKCPMLDLNLCQPLFKGAKDEEITTRPGVLGSGDIKK
jgi:hypothetical protein